MAVAAGVRHAWRSAVNRVTSGQRLCARGAGAAATAISGACAAAEVCAARESASMRRRRMIGLGSQPQGLRTVSGPSNTSASASQPKVSPLRPERAGGSGSGGANVVGARCRAACSATLAGACGASAHACSGCSHGCMAPTARTDPFEQTGLQK